MFLRRSAFFFIPYESNFYMISYIALFYTSFLYHAIKTPEYFGRLIIRSDEHTSELQSLMRLSYAVFCLKKTKKIKTTTSTYVAEQQLQLYPVITALQSQATHKDR